mmetsp:Transcript_64578/g.124516  ORF Transcript_64578/g.124516 Transcript_64578/m.124516 type:complete len:204 (+) Transcript_64578:88-699(+)
MATSWDGILQAAITANEQVEFQVRKSRQARNCLVKLLRASRMHTECLRDDQRMLRYMLHQVKVAHGRPSAPMLPPDMHRQLVSPSWDEMEVELQELKDVFCSLIAANECHETWRKLSPVLAKLPAPEPDIISGPEPEELPWTRFRGTSMEASALPSEPQAALRARLLPAPEFKLGSMTAAVPQVGDGPENLRSAARSSHESFR